MCPKEISEVHKLDCDIFYESIGNLLPSLQLNNCSDDGMLTFTELMKYNLWSRGKNRRDWVGVSYHSIVPWGKFLSSSISHRGVFVSPNRILWSYQERKGRIENDEQVRTIWFYVNISGLGKHRLLEPQPPEWLRLGMRGSSTWYL